MRTKELTGDIAVDGCDVIEATMNAVAVQAMPDEERKNRKISNTYQSDYEEKTKADPDMAPRLQSLIAIAGSLSHSHFNCLCRNILDGRSGCECDGSVVTECQCKNKQILRKDGKYDLERIKARDKAWYDLIKAGIPWEMLTWRMEIEEPDAARIISIALNKKNEFAMKTSHTEIMNSLGEYCDPTPGALEVPWEPTRDKMIALYGSAVDHPDFFQAFRLVLDLGGKTVRMSVI